MDRNDVTQMVIAAKRSKKITWPALAKVVGQSKEWTAAALLGQMAMTQKQAEAAGKLLKLNSEAVALLQVTPYKGSLGESVPTDPLIYRLYEIVQIYGTSIKDIIHEEFGDGIMSAIDFDMKIERQPDPKGDRVKITMSGKYLGYKAY